MMKRIETENKSKIPPFRPPIFTELRENRGRLDGVKIKKPEVI